MKRWQVAICLTIFYFARTETATFYFWHQFFIDDFRTRLKFGQCFCRCVFAKRNAKFHKI